MSYSKGYKPQPLPDIPFYNATTTGLKKRKHTVTQSAFVKKMRGWGSSTSSVSPIQRKYNEAIAELTKLKDGKSKEEWSKKLLKLQDAKKKYDSGYTKWVAEGSVASKFPSELRDLYKEYDLGKFDMIETELESTIKRIAELDLVIKQLEDSGITLLDPNGNAPPKEIITKADQSFWDTTGGKVVQAILGLTGSLIVGYATWKGKGTFWDYIKQRGSEAINSKVTELKNTLKETTSEILGENAMESTTKFVNDALEVVQQVTDGKIPPSEAIANVVQKMSGEIMGVAWQTSKIIVNQQASNVVDLVKNGFAEAGEYLREQSQSTLETIQRQFNEKMWDGVIETLEVSTFLEQITNLAMLDWYKELVIFKATISEIGDFPKSLETALEKIVENIANAQNVPVEQWSDVYERVLEKYNLSDPIVQESVMSTYFDGFGDYIDFGDMEQRERQIGDKIADMSLVDEVKSVCDVVKEIPIGGEPIVPGGEAPIEEPIIEEPIFEV